MFTASHIYFFQTLALVSLSFILVGKFNEGCMEEMREKKKNEKERKSTFDEEKEERENKKKRSKPV